MKTSIPAAVLATTVCLGFAGASAAQLATHGGLPIYPHTFTTPDENAMHAGMSKNQADKAALFVDSNDAPHTVDVWYRSNLPASCKRLSSSGSVQYRCPAGIIDILPYHGKTRISLIPD